MSGDYWANLDIVDAFKKATARQRVQRIQELTSGPQVQPRGSIREKSDPWTQNLKDWPTLNDQGLMNPGSSKHWDSPLVGTTSWSPSLADRIEAAVNRIQELALEPDPPHGDGKARFPYACQIPEQKHDSYQRVHVEVRCKSCIWGLQASVGCESDSSLTVSGFEFVHAERKVFAEALLDTIADPTIGPIKLWDTPRPELDYDAWSRPGANL